MSSAPSVTTLHDRLPGDWSVKATNFPMWLKGDRLQPRFRYGLITESPLVLSDEVAWVDAETGEEKTLPGRDTWRGDEFVWRGTGLLRLVASRWTVAASSDDGTIAVVRFSKSLATPAGVDVIVREDAEHPEVRATIAHSTERFGLTPEDFGSLSWLVAGRTG